MRRIMETSHGRLLASIIVTCLLWVAFPTYGYAQRTVKELAKMTKGCEASLSTEISDIPMISLHSVDSTLLNTNERELLLRYKDAYVCRSEYKGKAKIPYCYFVIDSIGRTGIYGLDGKMLVPPLYGKALFFWRGVVVGEMEYSTHSEWMQKVTEYGLTHNGLGLGHFQAFIDDVWKDKIHVVIPAGTYDDIQATFKRITPDFFVAKLDAGDTLRWGVVDIKGKEIMPCEYLGIYKKNPAMGFMTANNIGGKYIGSNVMTMEEAEKFVENREEIARQRREAWARYLNATADVLNASAEMMNRVQSARGSGNSGTASSSSSSSSSGGSYQQQYNNWERRAESCYNSLTNLGASSTNKKTGETSGTTLQSMSGSNYTQMKKSLREAQSEMKTIRQKAKKQGITIAQSRWETATVKY